MNKSEAYDALFDPGVGRWRYGMTHAQAAQWVTEHSGSRVSKNAARKACAARRDSAGVAPDAQEIAAPHRNLQDLGGSAQDPTSCNAGTQNDPSFTKGQEHEEAEPPTLPSARFGTAPPPEPSIVAPADPRRDPEQHKRLAPDGYHLVGVSTLVDGAGNPVQQWIKTRRDRHDRLEELLQALPALLDPIRGAAEPATWPAHTAGELAAIYGWGDPHLGMYAWGEECGGADWNLEIAECVHVSAVEHAVAIAPPAERAIVLTVGDTTHTDNATNRTNKSGHALDVDTRWQRVFRAVLRTLRRAVDLALTKHHHVEVKTVGGNHDVHTTLALALALDALYEREPRVTVDTSPDPFLWWRWGNNLIGFVHGDKTKPADLPAIMACDQAEAWGRCEHRHWYTGHVHHDQTKEYRGCTVETLRTLAARDAWHHGEGYRAGRGMKLDVWHQQHGRINEHHIGISQVQS